MIRKFFLALFLFIIASALLFFWEKVAGDKEENRACFKDECFYMELAKTASEKNKGLMFRDSLAEDRGMLFIFESEGIYPFWMKNMKFPLDIIWLNGEKEVVFIAKGEKPCQNDFCPLIDPGKKATYVLEINAGLSDAIGLKIGEEVDFADF